MGTLIKLQAFDAMGSRRGLSTKLFFLSLCDFFLLFSLVFTIIFPQSVNKITSSLPTCHRPVALPLINSYPRSLVRVNLVSPLKASCCSDYSQFCHAMEVIWQGREGRKLSSRLVHSWRSIPDWYLWQDLCMICLLSPQLLSMLLGQVAVILTHLLHLAHAVEPYQPHLLY